ncbi:MAG: hypothetical protein WED01_02455, partial [Candidatus Rokuibacteriota bacterium]
VGGAGTLMDRWFPARRLARLAEAEVEQELEAARAGAVRPRVPGRESFRLWAILTAAGSIFVWTGFSHMHILKFNAFLGLTLVLAFGTMACFARRAP